MAIKLSKKQHDLIERFGVFMERSGSAPAQARILGLLMVCDKGELTFEEIYQTLKISKSAASNAINNLLTVDRIEYHTKPGDRKRYFSTRIGEQGEDFEKSMHKLLEVKEIIKLIVKNRPQSTKVFNTKLQKSIDFMEFLEQELPAIYHKWRLKNK